MEKMVIRGGCSLRGTVAVAGSKNAALPIMAACLLADEAVILDSVPRLADVETLSQVLDGLGLGSIRLPTGAIHLEVNDASRSEADADLVRRMRASFCVLGPLLARRGFARVALPGGCRIGDRPVELHLKGLAALGAEITIENEQVTARARKLRGATMNLCGERGTTVTGTCNIMSAAVLAKGDSWLVGAAREPEVIDLGRFLNELGARIDGLGTSRIHIRGVPRLGGGYYRIIPDRIEAATLMGAAAISRGEINLVNIRRSHLTAVIAKLRRIGLTIDGDRQSLSVRGDRPLQATDIETAPYPGFPTDVQAQLTAILSLAHGTSHIRDCVFPDRFHHLAELRRMGAQVRQHGNEATVIGVGGLRAAEVTATDLRASAALLIAALAARGETSLRHVYHLDRGYDGLDQKLTSLGAEIHRVPDEATERRAA